MTDYTDIHPDAKIFTHAIDDRFYTITIEYHGITSTVRYDNLEYKPDSEFVIRSTFEGIACIMGHLGEFDGIIGSLTELEGL